MHIGTQYTRCIVYNMYTVVTGIELVFRSFEIVTMYIRARITIDTISHVLVQ